MPTHDILDNREGILLEHVKSLLRNSATAKFAVGYLFTSGLTPLMDDVQNLNELKREINHDICILQEIYNAVGVIDPEKDDKLKTLQHLLSKPPLNHAKVLIFTQYADTAEYLLSEGLNLQDAFIVINYDLHWNPVRLIQRIGRLDRIGALTDVVYVHNFLPETKLEQDLRLKERIQHRIDKIHHTIGEDERILDKTEQINEDAMQAPTLL
jgi:ERCC4-related helicase